MKRDIGMIIFLTPIAILMIWALYDLYREKGIKATLPHLILLAWMSIVIILMTSCVSVGYSQRKVAEARREEQERCERWLDKIASKELTPRDAEKIQDETYKRERAIHRYPEVEIAPGLWVQPN